MAKKQRKPQAPKTENRGWRDARLQHSNMNLTVPAKKGAGSYKRAKAGARGKDW